MALICIDEVFLSAVLLVYLMEILLQQIKALLESIGSSFCPDYLDWFGNESVGFHSRNADRSVLSKFLQARPADFSTTKLQVRQYSFINFNLNFKKKNEFLEWLNLFLFIALDDVWDSDFLIQIFECLHCLAIAFTA